MCGVRHDGVKREPFRTHSRCATHLDDAWFARLHAMVCGEPLNYSVTDKCRICCDEVEPEGEEVNPSCALCGSVVHGHCYSSFAEQGQLNVKEGEAVGFTCAECTLLHWVPCVLLQALAGWGDATVGPSGKKLVVLPLWEDAPEWLKKLYENKFLVQVRQGNTPSIRDTSFCPIGVSGIARYGSCEGARGLSSEPSFPALDPCASPVMTMPNREFRVSREAR